MTNYELTQYIIHYIKKDKTKMAVMISGNWGTGKSYYIQHELIPELQKNDIADCVTVSLYGLKTINEISRSIYIELKAKALQNKGEIASTGKIVGKTIIKGITSFFGIDLSVSENDMQQIYDSVDVSGKLIILEDIERSPIGILDLLGYINNLVEQDRVKVLLVANENEIIQYEQKGQGTSDKKSPELIDETQKYLVVKEKTIGDTLQFEGDLKTAVQQIIKSYENPNLNKFANENCARDICRILEMCKSNNLRAFIFACQKTVDIFEQMTEFENEDFVQCVFYGIIFFSLRLKSGKNMHWNGEEVYSVNLGHENAPLFKFCYEYIMYQKLDISKIPIAVKALSEKQLYDKHKTISDPDLVTLFCYYENYENDILVAVQKITERLKNPQDISFYDYGKIALYLVLIKDLLGCDIELAKKRLINNLEGRGKKLRLEQVFSTVPGDEVDESVKAEYEKLYKQMVCSLRKDIQKVPDFKYLPEQAEMFYNYVAQNEGVFHLQRCFASNLDIPRLTKMFEESSPEQRNDIRRVFLLMYRPKNIKQSLANDSLAIGELLASIKDNVKPQSDKIQQLQYQYFIENLSDIWKRLQ